MSTGVTFYDKSIALSYKSMMEHEGHSMKLIDIGRNEWKVIITHERIPLIDKESFAQEKTFEIGQSAKEQIPPEHHTRTGHKYNITEVELTEKGRSFLDKNAELPQDDPLFAKGETLQYIHCGELNRANDPEYGAGYAASKLLEEGLVKPISFAKVKDDAIAFLGKTDPELGKAIEDYIQQARGKGITEETLNRALQILMAREAGDAYEESYDDIFEGILSQGLENVSHSDKIIALDTAISMFHVYGLKSGGGTSRYPEETGWNKVAKLLSVLQDGDIDKL